MTEVEWLTCEDPHEMLQVLSRATRQRARNRSPRKHRLFSCACSHLVWHALPSVDWQRAVEAAESVAEGKTFVLSGLETALPLAYSGVEGNSAAQNLITNVCRHDGSKLSSAAVAYWTLRVDLSARARMAVLLRDIFGVFPFRSVKVKKEWLTSTVIALGSQAYDTNNFGAMPILADAIQEAGCDNEDILSHCRDTNQLHVRGCWVVDLVLGKE